MQIYNKFTKHYTRPMLQTDENIIYLSSYTQICQHGESQQNMSQFSCYYSSVHNTVSSANIYIKSVNVCVCVCVCLCLLSVFVCVCNYINSVSVCVCVCVCVRV